MSAQRTDSGSRIEENIWQVFVENGGSTSVNLSDTYRTLHAAQSKVESMPRNQRPYIVEYQAIAVHRPIGWTCTPIEDAAHA